MQAGDISSFELYNLSGSLIKQAASSLNTRAFELDLSAYDNGTYIIRINTEDKTYTKQIIKL